MNAARSFTVKEFSYTPPTYNAGQLRCEHMLTSSVGESVTEILTRPTAEADQATKTRWRSTISMLIPKLQRVQSELTDWKDESQWISDFHNQLDFYKRIWATAMYESVRSLEIRTIKNTSGNSTMSACGVCVA